MKRFGIRFRTVALLAVGLGVSGASGALAADSVKIGLLLPYKGVYAQLAEGIDSAWQLALEQHNGMAGTAKIEILREDTEANPSIAVQKANKLIRSDDVDILAGVVSSGVGVALGKVAERQKRPLVLAFAVADVITGKFCNPYVARTSFSANAFQSGSGAYWANQGVETAVTMGPDYAAGHAMIAGFKKGYEAAGGKVVEEMWSAFRKTKDWGSYLTKAKNSGAEMIYAFYGGSESIQVVKQHAAFGLKESMPLRGAQWLYDESLWAAMGDAVVGARFTTIHFPDAPHENSKKFVAAYAKKFGKEPDVNAAVGYDNAIATLETAAKLNGDVEDGANFIKTMRESEFASPRGTLRFNKDNNAQPGQLYLVQVVKGEDGKLRQKMVDSFPGGEDLPGCPMGG